MLTFTFFYAVYSTDFAWALLQALDVADLVSQLAHIFKITKLLLLQFGNK